MINMKNSAEHETQDLRVAVGKCFSFKNDHASTSKSIKKTQMEFTRFRLSRYHEYHVLLIN